MKSGPRSIGPALAAATCALLGSRSAAAEEPRDEDRWSIDTALLYYGEDDDRVQDVSLNALARRDFGDERFLDLNLTIDTLTGASPSGATSLETPQTFTSPSGRAIYTTPGNAVPLDDTFLDTRYAASASWSQPLARLYRASAGVGFSSEYDYMHLGVNGSIARDFDNRNTTLSAAIAWSQDEIDPVGGIPRPLSAMLDIGDLSNRTGSDSKSVVDVVLGVTQVISRTTVLRVNYSFSDSSGYLNDPYKFLSLVDPVTGQTLSRVPAPGQTGPGGVYLFESRPDSRTKHGLYVQAKKWLDGKTLDLSYRFMTDDWGIDSHTLEGRLRWPVSGSSYLEPHLRYYTQTAADFYRLSIPDDGALPAFATADYRMGEFDAITLGLKFGHVLPSGNEWGVRLEYYQHANDLASSQLIGDQRNREQVLDLNAVIAQFSYRFSF
jgi:hypothetical protein